MATDSELAGLLWDRARLVRQIAPILRYVGHAHPKRAEVNARRAIERKRLKKALRKNAEAIAARCMHLYPPPENEMTAKRKPKRTRTQNLAATHMTTSEVAIYLSTHIPGKTGWRYQKTRDLILTGACGTVEWRDDKMYVPRRDVEKYVEWKKQIDAAKEEARSA